MPGRLNPEYHTIEVWGQIPDSLDNLEVVASTLADNASRPLLGCIEHAFYPQGVSAIVLGGQGELLSAHTWPEFELGGYGIFTYFGFDTKDLSPFKTNLSATFGASNVRKKRPQVNHLITVVETQGKNYLKDPETLEKDSLEIARNAGLKRFDQPPILAQHLYGISSVHGLEASHIAFLVQPTDQDGYLRVIIDALTCEEESDLSQLTDSIRRTMLPIGLRSIPINYPREVSVSSPFEVQNWQLLKWLHESQTLSQKVDLD
jgi:S-adenosylmethionine/arginine decarboxylase-like enzyme